MDSSGQTTNKDLSHHNEGAGAGFTVAAHSNQAATGSIGSSMHTNQVEASLNQAVSGPNTNAANPSNSGTQSSDSSSFNHISPKQLKDPKPVNSSSSQTEANLGERLGSNGDLLDPGGGTNTVIASSGNDIILGNGGGFNTITTGNGQDLIVLGRETTNRVFDFNPSQDQFGVADDLRKDLLFGQGQNPTKGGIDQPLDSENNTVIIDRSTDHILASLTFTDAEQISDRNFLRVEDANLQALQNNTGQSTSKTA